MQPKVDVPVPPDGAKVLMVKFNDYQCPPCRQTYEAYGPLLEKWTKTGQFKFVLKHFPLEAECNGAAPGGPHPAACEAAAAVVMARRKNEDGRKAGALALRAPGAAAPDARRGQGGGARTSPASPTSTPSTPARCSR